MRDASLLCFFGLGVRLQENYAQVIAMTGRPPDFFCDNNPKFWGQTFQGVPCISPEDLSRQKEQVHILITSRFFDEIGSQLASKGLHNLYYCDFVKCQQKINAVYEWPKADVKDAIPIDIKNKWALVTGASRGIGFHIAQYLAQNGTHIIALSRHGDHNKSIEKVCLENRVQCHSLGLDFSDEKDLDSLEEKLSLLPHPVEIIYNCAGISLPPQKDLWNIPQKTMIDSFRVNAIAPIKICNFFIPRMIDQGWGRIVNISSTIQNDLSAIAYACSKIALDKYVHDILDQLKKSNVKISLLDPGWLKTDMGGPDAPFEVATVLPGGVLGTLMPEFENGRWFSAQDYSNMTLQQAFHKAQRISD